MTLRHLEIFRNVCHFESITLAAEHLNMSQPAVSLAIRELESFYNSRLFERMNRRIYITEAGVGITILARSLVEASFQKGTLKELSVPDVSFSRQYYLSCHKSKYLTDGIRQVIQIIRDGCKTE